MVFRDDFHIHAAFYRQQSEGGKSGPKVIDQINAAKAAGTRYIGIVEHCNVNPTHPFHSLIELKAEFETLKTQYSGIFRGVEADLLDGGIDCCGNAGRSFLGLDYVIGSVHLSPGIMPRFADYLETEYSRIMLALKNNSNIDIVGHPFISGTRYQKAGVISKWDYSQIPSQWLWEIIRTAKESGKALEVNYRDFNDPFYRNFLADIRDAGVRFCIGSDAHDIEGHVRLESFALVLDELKFTTENQWLPGGASCL